MRLTSVALILSFGHLSEGAPWDAQAALDASKTPQPADLRGVLAAIPSFGRPLRIASPCVGIHGCGVACQAMRVDARYVNVWDLEAGYEGWLRHLLGGADCVTQLNLGAEPFGARSLRDALGQFPVTPRESLTKAQRRNLENHEALIREKVQEGKLNESDIVVISIDRAVQGPFNITFSVNECPTLLTHNTYLYVLSVGCVARGVPDAERAFSRLLRPTERLAMQGFPPEVAAFLGAATLVTKAAGNAYAPHLICAVLAPMLAALKKSGLCLETWPPPALQVTFQKVIRYLKANLDSQAYGPDQIKSFTDNARRNLYDALAREHRMSLSDASDCIQDSPFNSDDRNEIIGAINTAVGLGGHTARATLAEFFSVQHFLTEKDWAQIQLPDNSVNLKLQVLANRLERLGCVYIQEYTLLHMACILILANPGPQGTINADPLAACNLKCLLKTAVGSVRSRIRLNHYGAISDFTSLTPDLLKTQHPEIWNKAYTDADPPAASKVDENLLIQP
ncbi:unnamed protein product, partial [Prorocentrum cordatum]